MDWAIEFGLLERCLGWIGGVLAEEEVPSGLAAGFRDGKVGAITVNVEDHVAGVIADGGPGVCGCIIEELNNCSRSSIGGFGLDGSNGA